MKKLAVVIMLGLMSASLVFGADPSTYVTHQLYTIDAVAPTTISATGDSVSSPIYGVPVNDSRVPWIGATTGAHVWDFGAVYGSLGHAYDLWVGGTISNIVFDSTNGMFGDNNGWMTLGLLDKHHLDGLAVGQDPAITYGSGSYGFGWNGGVTIPGANVSTRTDANIKTEDGWSKQGTQAFVGGLSFDFLIRYGFTDGADRDTRTIRAWFKPVGDPPANWVEWGETLSLGYPCNANNTSRPARYLNDQWDQVQVGAMITHDGAFITTTMTIADMTMQIDALGGDANLDGVVDDEDASILGSNWQVQSGATWLMGDFNFDAKVDDADAAIMAAHFGQTAEGSSVPEPSTLCLLVLGALALIGRKLVKR